MRFFQQKILLFKQLLKQQIGSHAPYSNSFRIALQLQDKRIFQGSYAENAAFNPSLYQLWQTALNYLLLSGNEVENIERAVLIEHPMSLSYRAMAEDLLAYLVENVTLEYISL